MLKNIFFFQKSAYITLMLFLIWFLIAFLMFFKTNDLFAEDLTSKINNIEINNSQHDLSIAFFAKNNISAEFQEILKSGIPLKYIYEINIIEEGLIRDSTLFSEDIIYQINFDNLKDEIRITSLNNNVKVFNLKKFNEAETIIFENQLIKINKKSLNIKKGGVYSIRIRSIIERVDSNTQFGFFPFFHSKNITSKWNEVKFLY